MFHQGLQFCVRTEEASAPSTAQLTLPHLNFRTRLCPQDRLDLDGWHQLTQDSASFILSQLEYATQRHPLDNAFSVSLSYHSDPLHMITEVGQALHGPILGSPARAALTEIAVWTAIGVHEVRRFSDRDNLRRSHKLSAFVLNKPVGVAESGRLYVPGLVITIPKPLPVEECVVRDEAAFITAVLSVVNSRIDPSATSSEKAAVETYLASAAITKETVVRLREALRSDHHQRRQRLEIRGAPDLVASSHDRQNREK